MPDYVAPPPPSDPAEVPVNPVTAPAPDYSGVVGPTRRSTTRRSTAPKPLFDTQLTVEEVIDAADSDHDTDLITIGDEPLLHDPDVPPVASPESESVPAVPTFAPELESRPTTTEDVSIPEPDPDPEPDPEPEPDRPSASYLLIHSESDPEPGTEPVIDTRKLEGFERELHDEEAGVTEAYVRRLHEKAGYVPPDDVPRTRRVEDRKLSQKERMQRRRDQKRVRADAIERRMGREPKRRTINPANSNWYLWLFAIGFVTVAAWFSVLDSLFGGNLNGGNFIWALVLTALFRYVWRNSQQ